MLTSLLFLCLTQKSPTLDADALKLFAWFDSVGYTQYLTKPFVKVEPRGMVNFPEQGFLMSDTAESFEILTLNQGVLKYYNKGGNQGGETPHHVPVNLAAYMRETIRVRKLPQDDQWDFYSKIWQGPLASIGWICHHIGLEKEAGDVMAMDEANPREWYGDGSKVHRHKRSEYISLATDDVMNELMNEEYQRFEDQNMNRSALRDYFADHAKRFAGTIAAEDFAKTDSMLRTMVEEEKSYKPDPSTEKGRIADSIWRLRDDSHGYFRWGGDGNDPRSILEKFGAKSVPQLIDAIKDRRFSRSLVHPMSGPPMRQSSETVVRVGDIALEVLEEISHQSFWGGTIAERQTLVRRWFEQFNSKGEKQLLVDKARLGGYEGYSSVRPLAEKYPDVALGPIADGYAKSKEESYRREYIRSLETLSPAKVETFLRSVIVNDKSAEPRIEAIKLLARNRPDDAVNFAKIEWTKVGPHEGFNSGFSGLVEFTYESQRADLVEIMAKHLRTSSASTRLDIIHGHSDLDFYPERLLKANAIELAKYKNAVEDMMASELYDEERCNAGMSGGNYDLNGPKMSRVAVLTLSEFLPGVYSFQDTKSLSGQAKQRDDAQKIYSSRRRKTSPVSREKPNLFTGPSMAIGSVAVVNAKSSDEKQTSSLLQKYKGKILNHTSLTEIIHLLAKQVASKQTRALSFTADRDGSSPGFNIVVSYRDDVHQGVGECVLEGESRRGMKAPASKYLGPWEKDLIKSLDAGFNASTDKNIEIEFELDRKPDLREG